MESERIITKKQQIAIISLLVILFNVVFPILPLSNYNSYAATGVIEEVPFIMNNLGISEISGKRVLTVQLAYVSEATVNGFDLRFKTDMTKLKLCRSTTGADATLFTQSFSQWGDYQGTLHKKTYDKNTGIIHMTATEPAGGIDATEDGYGFVPGTYGDPNIDDNGAGYPAYYPIGTLTFVIKDDSLNESNIGLDLFELVPIPPALPTGLTVNYSNSKGVTIDKAVQLGGKGFAQPEKNVQEIAVKTNPSNLDYEHGNDVNLTGGVITVTYDDNTTGEIDMTDPDVSIQSGSPADVKNPVVTIAYKGKTTTFPITVSDPVQSLAVTSPMNKTEYDTGKDLDFTGLQLTATKKSGATETLQYNSDGVTISETMADVNSSNFKAHPDDGTGIKKGIQTIVFTYEGKNANATITVNDKVASISVTKQPTKKIYKYGEDLALNGAVVTVTFESGNSSTLNLPDGNIGISTFSNTTTGSKQNLTVTYGEKTATETIAVEVYDYVTNVTFTAPNKDTYKIGETPLNVTGGRFLLTWASGKTPSNIPLTVDMVAGFTTATVGVKTLTASYDPTYTLSDGTKINDLKTAEFDIEVVREINTITVTAPSKTTYYHGETLNLAGGTITIHYDDNKTETRTMTESMMKEADGSAVNMSPDAAAFGNATTLDKIVTITYQEEGKTGTVQYPITIINTMKSIALQNNPQLQYNVNDPLQSGLSIFVTREVGTPEAIEITEDMIRNFDTSTEGTKTAVITYTENGVTKTVNYQYTVTDMVKSIAIKTPPKEAQKYGEELDLVGATIEVVKGSKTEIIAIQSSMIQAGTYDKTTLGDQTVTVTYGTDANGDPVTTTFPVKVKDYVTGITINPDSVTGDYNTELADIIRDNHIQYVVTYAKGGVQAPVDVTESMVENGYNKTSLTAQALTVTYTDNNTDSYSKGDEFTATLTVTLSDVVESITVKAPTKVTYNHADSLDLAGGTITVKSLSGATKTVTMTESMMKEADGSAVNMSPTATDFGSNTTLAKTLTITYEEGGQVGTASYPITIINDVRKVESYAANPPKKEYNVKDTLDKTGEILVTRAVGTPEAIVLSDPRVEVTGFKSDKNYDDLPLTITFTENNISKELIYHVKVKDTVKSIRIDTNHPPKADYKYNEAFNTEIGKIIVEYGSGEQSIALSQATVTELNGDPFDPTDLTTRNLLVTYEGKTTQYEVRVKDYITKIEINPTSITGNINDELADLISAKDVQYTVTYAKAGVQAAVDVTESMILPGYDKTSIEAQNVTVEYIDTDATSATKGEKFTATLTITLSDVVESITVKAPTKVTYNHGDSLDLAGGTITVRSISGATKTVTMTESMLKEADGSAVNMSPTATDFGSNTTLAKTLTITYEEGGQVGTASYPITIINDVRKVESHATNPPKKEYNVKDTLDKTGEILVTRAVGTPEAIVLSDPRVEVTGFKSDKNYDDLPLTITFTENDISKELIYHVKVKDTVKSIRIDTNHPPKADYKYNEAFNTAIGKIIVEYGSGEQSIPLSQATVTELNGNPFDPTDLTTRNLLVTYEGKTTQYEVRVKDYITKIEINPTSITGNINDELADLISAKDVQYTVTYAKAGVQAAVDVTESMILPGYDKTSIEAQNVTVEFTDTDATSATKGEKFTATLTITLSDEIVDIVIKNMPKKTEYGYGDPFNPDGGVITVIRQSGKSEDIPFGQAGVSITETNGDPVDLTKVTFDGNHQATKKIKVTYEGKEKEFTVKVINQITKIEMEHTPKTDYKLNEPLDLTTDGTTVGTILVTRQNNETESIPLDHTNVTVTGFDSSEETKNLSLEVSYTENTITKTTHYTVNVMDNVVDIELENTPKTQYKYGETLDVSTGTLKIIRDSGEVSIPIKPEMVTEADGSPFNGNILGTRDLTITYGGKTLMYSVTVSDYVKGIILTRPSKEVYEYGESLDLTGGSVQKVMASGATTSPVALSDSSVTLSTFNPNQEGTQSIQVTYEGFTQSFGVTVKDSIQTIAISSLPTKRQYKYGEALSVVGGKITVTKSSGKTEIIDMTTSMVSNYNPNQLGKQTLTVTYKGQTVNYEVNVEDYVKSMSIHQPDKLIYKVGESIDLTGGTVQVVMASGATTSPVAMTNAMITGFDTTSEGAKLISVTYQGFTKTFGITVVDELKGMIIKTLPNKLTYRYGESLDVTGGKIEIQKESGAKEVVNMTKAMVSGYNPKKLGSQTLTITYKGLTQSFIVTVEDYVSTLKVQAPSKVEYEYGEYLDLTGGKVYIVMASGKVEEAVDMTASMTTGFDRTKEGKQTIKVTYKGLQGSFQVTVVDKIKGISLNSEPSKKTYEYGEAIDVTGATIKVIKSSGMHTVTVTKDMISGYHSDQPGTQFITITYGGFTANFIVWVKEPQKTSQNTTTKPSTNGGKGNRVINSQVEQMDPDVDVSEVPELPEETTNTPVPSPSTKTPKTQEKPTKTLGVKDEKEDNSDNSKVIATSLAIGGIFILLLLLAMRRNVKIYVEEENEFVLGGLDKISRKNLKLDVDQYLDGETCQGKVKIVLNDSISEKLDGKELSIKHRGKTITRKIKYQEEPYEIILK